MIILFEDTMGSGRTLFINWREMFMDKYNKIENNKKRMNDRKSELVDKKVNKKFNMNNPKEDDIYQILKKL